MNDERYARTPPHDLDLERAVIGACLASPPAFNEVQAILDAEDFYSEIHRIIFRGIKAAAQELSAYDHLAVIDQLRQDGKFEEIGGRAYITELIESVPTASNAPVYAEIVKKASQARSLIDAGTKIVEKGFAWGPEEDVVSYSLGIMEEIVRQRRRSGAVTYKPHLEEYFKLLSSRRREGGITGIRTGFDRMDRELGGLKPGHSYVFAASTGVGKSLLVGQIAQIAGVRNHRVLWQTPEMSALMCLDRLAHAVADVNYEKSRRGDISAAEENDIRGAAAIISNLPIYVDDEGTQTPSSIRANVMRYEPDLLIVDYLTYVEPDVPNPQSRNNEVGAISRALTRIKSDFKIPVVLAAQLNRGVAGRANKRPNLADLRDSGEIEQDADAVMFLHRPHRWDESEPEDEVEIHCEKWRYGDLWMDTLYLKPGIPWLLNERGGVA